MLLEKNHFFDFGDFRLDPSEKMLSCAGKSVALTPKVFETLEVLLTNAGHLLSKDELINKIWPDHFVEESNLTFNIKMLRRALGDNASSPRFIETIPRRGYRFIAEVRETIDNEPKNRSTIKVIQPGRISYFSIAAIIILSLGTFVVASWLVRKEFPGNASSAPILSAPFHSEKFSNSGKVSNAAISPDGKLVAFADESGGKFGVWLRRLETSENIQIISPSDDFYFGFVFSHDGRELYFVRRKQIGTTLANIYRMSVFGGAQEKILEHAEGWISLSPNDRQVSFVRCDYRDDEFCSLFVADVSGHDEHKILTRRAPVRITDNQFSPDGASIAFAAGESFNGASDFRLLKIDLASGEESEISPRKFFEITSLRWLPDGGILAAAKETLDGKVNIWRVSTMTGETQQMTKDAANYTAISLNGDASEMISTQVSSNFQLYLSSNGATKGLTAAREAVFAPDGKIVYAADDGDIWTINREGGEQRQLTSNTFKDFRPYVAPDGRFIYFASNRTGANQIWRMNRDGSNQTEITKNEGGYPVFASPDGRWIYFESGMHETLWKVSTDSGEEIQVSDRKLNRTALSPDGTLAAFFFHDPETGTGSKIAVMAIADKEIIKVLNFADSQSLPIQIAWSNDNRTVNYVTSTESKNSLWKQSIDQDSPEFAADLGDDEVVHFALAPDDNSFIFIRGEWLHDAVLLNGLR